MTQLPKHGSFIRLEDLMHSNTINKSTPHALWQEEGLGQESPINLNEYDYLFKDLVDNPENLLDPTSEVIQALKDLGLAMKEETDTLDGDSNIPAAYTYLGQFIDHDITRDAASDDINEAPFDNGSFNPIPPNCLRTKLKNVRSGTFDLDSVYGGNPPLEGEMFKIGKVSVAAQKIPNKGEDNDLPRKTDGSKLAEIGDSRNDENTIIAQFHLALLKFHNAVMLKKGCGFTEAQKLVRQHYQWVVLHDFLKKICDAQIIDNILADGNQFYKLTDGNFFMPVEFSAAAYRYGHSMVRQVYNFNSAHRDSHVAHLFRFTGTGGMADMPTLPRDWIIEWDHFLPFQANNYNKARRINTRLSSALHSLKGPGIGIFQILAKINLLRGYLFSLPTGQAIARKILSPEDVLTGEQILCNATEAERTALESAGLHNKTPLWYYVLAEASIQHQGSRLGKLGSTIVAETIIGLIRRSEDSILNKENWRPELDADFNLERLIAYADLAPVAAV